MDDPATPIETVVVPRTSDLGDGFTVMRALPSAQRRMVGPFVFFDQMGPMVLAKGRGLDVRPHPHIGLATVTYLFAGEIMHRDSLGTAAPIRPGELNWMTAGRGIVHSERTPAELRAADKPLFGIQSWVALPLADEDAEPAFSHYDADALPGLDADGVSLRVIAGAAFGVRSPAEVRSPQFYVDAQLEAGARLDMPQDYDERAVYVLEGGVEVEQGHSVHEAGRLVVLAANHAATLRAGPRGARVMLLGGAPLDGPRFVWWNFVASSRERIEDAKERWRAGQFDRVPGETEFIPLPETKPARVDYP
jgi:hypothetical protein